MPYKIEKNVPTPRTVTKTRYPFAEMEIGDSFLIKTAEENDKVRNAAMMYRIRNSPKFIVTIQRVENGWRLWRIDISEKKAASEKPVHKLKTA